MKKMMLSLLFSATILLAPFKVQATEVTPVTSPAASEQSNVSLTAADTSSASANTATTNSTSINPALEVPLTCTPILSYSGTGDSVINNFVIPAGTYKVTMTHDGTHNFVVKFSCANKPYPDLLANKIGSYHGTALLCDGDTTEKQNAIFEVKADGNWTIVVSAVTNLSTTSMTGNGDKVTGMIIPSAKDNVLTLLHTGKRNFIVWSHDENNQRKLLANAVGEYNGQVLLQAVPGDNYYFDVVADGDWIITFGVDPTITVVEN